MPTRQPFKRGQEVRYLCPQGNGEDAGTRTLREAKRIWAQCEDGPADEDGWLFFCQLPDGRPRHGVPGRARDFEPI
jgi:hypothetical protein